MQGICRDEVNAFKLLSEDDSLLKGLAENAFSANIALAFLVASLVVF